MTKETRKSPCSPETLLLYHYGELDEGERERAESHLGQCALCRRELSQLRGTLDGLPDDRIAISPEQIRAFELRVTRQLRPRPPLFRPALGWSLAAAAAVLTVVLSVPGPGLDTSAPKAPSQTASAAPDLPDQEMLLNLGLLENLDLLEELEQGRPLG